MARNVQISFQPSGPTVTVPAGRTMLEAAISGGLQITAICGGRGTCHKCRVKAPGYPGPPRRAEREAFSPEELAEGWRLACLCKLHDDVQVEAVPAEDYAAKSFCQDDQPLIPLRPNVQRWNIELSPPVLADQRSDWQRLRDAIGAGGELRIGYRVLRAMSETLRRAGWRVSVTAIGDQVVEVEPMHLRPPLGVAVDIGTTSVVAMLVDLTTGKAATLGAHSNSQSAHGADVMARIDFSAAPGGTETLQREAAGDLLRIVHECCEQVSANLRDIYEVTVVANTTMAHLFLGLCPRYVGVSPFVGVTNGAFTVSAADLGLNLHPGAQVYVLPGVAGFVGADTIGVLLATGLHRISATVAAIDIGTNVEIVIAHGGRLLTCSAPAGPAFEGGEIRHGMRATAGAINTFVVDDNGMRYTTIGGVKPRGICGSALVDICAELYAYGLIHSGGRLLNAADLADAGHPDPLRLVERVADLPGGVRSFMVASGEESETGQPIHLTQLDIRKFQLAKAATLGGLQVLLSELGITAADLDELLIAGTFGSHIRVERALGAGLIPQIRPEKVRYVGNAALEGARMVLLNADCRQEAEELARRIEHVESAARADFQEIYVESLGFPAAELESGGVVPS